MSQPKFGFRAWWGVSSMMIGIAISLLLGVLVWEMVVSHAQQTGYSLDLPEGVLEPIIPEDNPLTEAKVRLGKALYFEKRLSVDDTVSCDTCHDPKVGFADGKKVVRMILQK